MGDFLKLNQGEVVEANAVAVSAGGADAGKIVKLGAGGKIDASMIDGGIENRSMTASEALSGGDLINIWNDGGTAKMRKADADNGRPTDGFVLQAVADGAVGTVYLEEGVISGLAGLTVGATYWLSTVAGGISNASPNGNNVLSQIVGKALSATELRFRPETAFKQVA